MNTACLRPDRAPRVGRRLPAALLVALAAQGCALGAGTGPMAGPPLAPVPGEAAPAAKAAPAPWTMYRRSDRRAGYRFDRADYAAPRVPVKADLAPIMAMLGRRTLQGLGFRHTGITSVTLSASGPGIAPDENIHVDVPLPTNTGSGLTPTNSEPLAMLPVPAGMNRLFVLEAKDAAGAVVARLRAVADVPSVGAAMTLDFTYQSDAAGRVMENLLFFMEPGVAASNAFLQSLATTSYGAALDAYVAHFTGYDAATNQFTGVNPVYFKDWVLATQLVSDNDGGARLTAEGFPNPGGAGSLGDLAAEARTTLHVSLHVDGTTPAVGAIMLYDPIDRGAGNLADVADPNEWVDGQGRFTSVPPGRWTYKALAGAETMRGTIDVPQIEGAGDYQVHLDFVAGSGPALTATVKAPTPPPPPPPPPFEMHEVRTFSGSAIGSANGPLATASFNGPRGLTFDGDALLVADTGNNLFRKIANGQVETLAGNFDTGYADDVPPLEATFLAPWAVATYPGHVIFGEQGHQRWRDMTYEDAANSYVVRDKTCCFGELRGVAVRPSNGHVYTIDGHPDIRKMQEWDPDGNPVREIQFGDIPFGLTMDASGDMYVCGSGDVVYKVSPTLATQQIAGHFTDAGFNDGVGINGARFRNPEGIAVSADGHRIWIADTGNHLIRQLTLNGDGLYASATIAGSVGTAGTTNGVGTAAQFSSPAGAAYDGGQFLYVADTGNHRLRKLRVQ